MRIWHSNLLSQGKEEVANNTKDFVEKEAEDWKREAHELKKDVQKGRLFKFHKGWIASHVESFFGHFSDNGSDMHKDLIFVSYSP